MADNFRDTISTEGLRLRFEMLNGFTIEQVERAAKRIMARRKFTKMPPIAEFLEELGWKPPSVEDKSIVAADDIIAHLNEHGASVPPDLNDPIAQRLMTERWPYTRWARTVLEKELVWWRKEFIEAYRAINARNEFIQIEDQSHRRQLKQLSTQLFESIGD